MVAQRGRLVSDMNLVISDGLDRSRLAKNQRETELFLDQLDRIVWPKIVNLSSTIYEHLIGDDDELDKEFKYQEQLRKDVAAIRFRAKQVASLFLGKHFLTKFYHWWLMIEIEMSQS